MIDPAGDMPQINWMQQGSFQTGSIPPVVSPAAGTQICLGPVAREWVPYIMGALDQLRNPSWMLVPDLVTQGQVLAWVDELRAIIATSTGCDLPVEIRLQNCVLQYSLDSGSTWIDVPGWVAGFPACVRSAVIPPPPLLPPGSSPAVRACNIAAYLSNDVIHVALTQAINAYTNNLSLLNLAANIAALTFAFELPWTTAALYAVYDLYALVSAANIADLRTAEADPILWSDVTCAIYNAIKADGMVRPGNCDAIIGALCSLSYTPAIAVTAICAYVTQLGCDGLRAAQVAGALNSADCSGCGAGCQCIEWQWYTTTANWTQDFGGYTAGAGYVMLNASMPSGNYMRVHASLVAAVQISDVWVGVGPCGGWTAGGTNYRRLTLLHGATIVGTVNFPTGAYASRTKVHASVPPVLFDNMVFEFVEDTSGIGGNVAYLEFLISGTNPFGTPCCTD